MRTYGRTYDANGTPTWHVVTTDELGYNDYVYITTLIQVLKLNLGESPFWGNFGIPAKNAIIQQIQPDYYVAFTQSYFAKFFASLIITKRAATFPPKPTYDISVIRTNGSKFNTTVAL